MIQEIWENIQDFEARPKHREERKHNTGKARREAVGSWRDTALSRVWGLGWVGTQRSLDLPQIVWLTLGRSLPLRFPFLFKEPELSFTNICLGSAYHQESNVELAPYSSPCLKFVGAVSSSQGWCTGLVVLRAAPGNTKRHRA